MGHSARALPAVAQAAAMSMLTVASRPAIRRPHRLPPIGTPSLLTTVLRLPGTWDQAQSAYAGHYVYPPGTVHLTVASLDGASRDTDEAISELVPRRLPAPTFTITGVGCSPGTVFLRCIHDDAFAELRAEVRRAFGRPPDRHPAGALFGRLSYANVVRFDGPAHWRAVSFESRRVTCDVLEVVRTDRVLSPAGTVVLARLPLHP
ncbi:MAG: hypothetical protein HZB15_18185 [Actinobacteria bacterium]|nr:hypothetical protein [Actinomycetota bacterium]